MISGFRPHVWGFFFHEKKMTRFIDGHMVVFVPMYGDSFFTTEVAELKKQLGMIMFSSPCMGILFSPQAEIDALNKKMDAFSSPCMGILFSLFTVKIGIVVDTNLFSSPCMGILFSREKDYRKIEKLDEVFVPMYGDSFFTVAHYGYIRKICWIVFVPMYGDSFFTMPENNPIGKGGWKFSSPCMGILFSQQAWDAPRGGLSMALLRRGFPIDWNSHYFHPLTFCFLRFHAHRRGFSK